MFFAIYDTEMNTVKRFYLSPCILQEVTVRTERDFLIGSIADWFYPVETAGQEVDQFVDYSFSGSDFNHTWGE